MRRSPESRRAARALVREVAFSEHYAGPPLHRLLGHLIGVVVIGGGVLAACLKAGTTAGALVLLALVAAYLLVLAAIYHSRRRPPVRRRRGQLHAGPPGEQLGAPTESSRWARPQPPA